MSLSPRKILVVEDEENVRRFIRIHLEFEGFSVTEAANGREGLEKAVREKPQLVITDVMMPEMDGVTLYKTLRAGNETKDIPIIVLTVKDSFEDVQKAYLIGVNDYLTKPFDPRVLVERVHEILH